MRRLAVSIVLAVLISAAPVRALEITFCGQVVPKNEVATLMNDLFCGNNNGPNVTLSGGATLKLNGHRIDGGWAGVATYPGSLMRILGPGEITGANGNSYAAAILPAGKVVVDTVWLHGNRPGIVATWKAPIRLSNVLITDNIENGIMTSFVLDGSFVGPGTGKISGRHVTVAGNGGDGISMDGPLSLRDTGINENGGAGIRIRGKHFLLQDVNVTDNGGGGVVSTSLRRGKLKSSSAMGNGPEGDIVAPVAPKLLSSTCEHSVDTDSGGTLGICTGD